ncbi:MAG TPA: transcriptional regulator NrdR [Oligoflexia bacterium]|nr:transcriptional regulator NrdR [Oligoflexia bacterium]HMP27215.1 transcriptional regulator NrdR [Oligoflexia bacterium]
MQCPRCDSDRLVVIDSRGERDEIRRRRECLACQYRFTTYERIELELPMIIKKDGSREPFNRNKIRAGLLKACEKRSISTEKIDQAVDQIEQKILSACVKEIQSQEIGAQVMNALRELDQIAFVRFASVYLEFSQVNQFAETLASLEQDSGKKLFKSGQNKARRGPKKALSKRKK